MTTNTGTLDRIARVVAGLVLVGLTLAGTIGVWGWIGLVPYSAAAVPRSAMGSVSPKASTSLSRASAASRWRFHMPA